MNSKLHTVCDGEGRPIVMLLSEGQMSDHKGARLRAGPRTICIVASVVMSALMWNFAMMKPLTKPTQVPQAIAAIRPSRIDPVAFDDGA